MKFFKDNQAMSQNLQLRKSGASSVGYAETSIPSLNLKNNNSSNNNGNNNNNNGSYFTDVFPTDGSSHSLLKVPYRYIASGTAFLPFFALVNNIYG